MIWDEIYCDICNKPFTEDEWDNRHSTEDGHDCHERCCPVCNIRCPQCGSSNHSYDHDSIKLEGICFDCKFTFDIDEAKIDI